MTLISQFEVRTPRAGLSPRLRALFAPYIPKWRRIVALNLIAEVAALLRPILYMVLIDRLLTHVTVGSILVLAAGLLLIAWVEGGYGYLRDALTHKAAAEMMTTNGRELWRRVLGSRADERVTWRGPDIAERVGALGSLFSSGLTLHTAVRIAVPSIIIALAVMVWINPVIASIYLFAIPLILLSDRLIAQHRATAVNDAFQGNVNYRSAAEEVRGGADTVRAFRAETYALTKVAVPMADVSVAAYRQGALTALAARVGTAIQFTAAALILLIGAIFVAKGALSLGQFVAFDMLGTQMRTKIGSLVGAVGQARSAVGSQAKVEELLDSFPLVEDSECRLADRRPEGRLQLIASYAYPNSTTATLDGACLWLEPGVCSTLTGASGAGKSTLGRALGGLLQDARVELSDSRGALNWSPALAARDVLYLPQMPHLFHGSVAENLLLKPQADLEPSDFHAVSMALREVELDDRLTPHSPLQGSRGLSGGQQQRLHLARTYFRDPAILILDEPTSALDEGTGTRVLERVLARHSRASILIISHDEVARRFADRVYALHAGEIYEKLDHDRARAQA